jgi:hypothetical protein
MIFIWFTPSPESGVKVFCGHLKKATPFGRTGCGKGRLKSPPEIPVIKEQWRIDGLTTLFVFRVQKRLNKKSLVITQIPRVGDRHFLVLCKWFFSFAGNRLVLTRGQGTLMTECICPHGFSPRYAKSLMRLPPKTAQRQRIRLTRRCDECCRYAQPWCFLPGNPVVQSVVYS